MGEEEAAHHLPGTRSHRRRQIAADGQVAGRHAVIRRVPPVSGIFGDVVRSHGAEAEEGLLEDGGVAWVREPFEVFRVRAGEAVEQEASAGIVHLGVEEGAELCAGDLYARVEHRLYDFALVELRRQRCADLVECLERLALLLQGGEEARVLHRSCDLGRRDVEQQLMHRRR
jgi:hypothetical protein